LDEGCDNMWDVFISHASEDKDALVRPLAKQLSEVYRVNVWYDEFSLEYGDSLLKSIEKGLQKSTFGVVIFSNNFFRKTWTDHEYTSLSTKEMLLNKKIIIPVWYNITKSEVAEYSLVLADKYAISLNDNIDIDDLAIKVIKIIRPDIYDNLSRMRYFEKIINTSEKAIISRNDFSKISIPPIRHETLSIPMRARLMLIHNAIKDVDTRSYEEYEEDFRRSTNIDRELIITELITAAYLECINIREMSLEERASVYVFIFTSGYTRDKTYINDDNFNTYIQILRKYSQGVDINMVMEYKFDIK